MIERPLTGVGALIISPESSYESFATITEGHTKRSTNKLRGMQSLPMETAEWGETYEQTLERLFEEEIRFLPLSLLLKTKLCTCELAPGVLVHLYLYEIPSHNSIFLGSHNQEVSNLEWVSFVDILNEPTGSLRFRPGAYECVVSCLDYLKDPENFQPPVISFHQLRHQIPHVVFNLIEAGFSEREVLFQLGLAPQFLPNFQLLSH
ncbi:NUDIX hydrolase [Patescibacteria group bacterium]|nr:NUDIX hydrolase [Patescibacteria group bacterium]